MNSPVRKVALVLGTRPEAIKLAPLYRELCRRPDQFRPLVWLTAQHRQMLDQALEAFEIAPDRDFDLMQPGQSLTRVTAAVLEALEPALALDRPDCILIQGDTTTVMAAALAAYYARVPVGHVEAGLRTGDKFAPYPEEMNRQIATRLADLHFAPTPAAQANLVAEGIAPDRIWVTGNTVIDALDLAVARTRKTRPALPEKFPLQQLVDGHPMVLITGHRRENFGPGLDSVCQAIADLARRYGECEWIYPVHLNPNVREPVHRLLTGLSNVHLTEPLAYLPFVWCMDRCRFLISDSGGVQEEAPHLGKPVLVTREQTERPEAIQAGCARLVGTDRQRIVAEAARLLDDPTAYAAMSQARNPFGDGQASRRIADALAEWLRLHPTV